MFKQFTRAVVGPFKRKGPAAKKVVILIPMSTRAELTPEEEISMRQILHYFGRYEKFLIVPEGMEISFEGFGVMHFPRRFFGSAANHGRMLNTPEFYRHFEDYEFIFFHHLDALAFSDQLEEWCDSDVDYIGPPWINCPDSPWVDRPRVGNGGFTLLRTQKALEALRSRHLAEPATFWLDLFSYRATPQLADKLERIKGIFPLSIVAKRLLKEWSETEDPSPNNRNNDIFWSDLAAYYLPDFKVASVEEGLRFAFEVSPRICLELNGGKMPFGCHAWARYDRAFWEPFIVTAGNADEVKTPKHEMLQSA
ncbi:MAG: DUF5672 family protein [Luteolibacter sp.]|uniref:DUF5672 family protein n=1 Tax=Luteolibacter sp. TaxID=1962973 RepID=UPI003263BB35